MPAASIGANVALQRENLGLDQAALASLAGIDLARVRSIESGAALSTWELDVLAQALAIDTAALRTGELADPRWSVARFRAPLGVSFSPLDLRRLARCAEAGRIHAFLRQELGGGPTPLLRLRAVKAIHGEPWRQGYSLGKAARAALTQTPAPIPSIQELLEKAGVLVLALRFDSSSIEGASLFELGASPVIVLNTGTQRFSRKLARRAILAHELCHLLHDGGERDLVTVVSRRDRESDPIEQRANGFAPNFIAPDYAVRLPSTATPRQKAIELATKWGLSFEGATWHAKNLERITPRQADALMAKRPLPRIDAPEFEPDVPRARPLDVDLEVEISELARSGLGDLAVRAVVDDVISVARAREILTLR